MHFVGAVLDPIEIGAFPLIVAQRSISGSPTGSPQTIADMLGFAVRHEIKPIVETFGFEEINSAVEKLRHGQPRYRIVLSRQ